MKYLDDLKTLASNIDDLKFVFENEISKAIEIIKNHKLLNYVIKNKKCGSMYHLDDEEINILKEVAKYEINNNC